MAKDINDPQSVTEFIEKLDPPFAELVEAIRQLILSTSTDIAEQIKWLFLQRRHETIRPKRI
jgi:hypothetical protein